MNKPTQPISATSKKTGSRADMPLAWLSLAMIAFIIWLAFSQQPQQLAGDAASLAPPEMTPCVMDGDGYVKGELYGSVRQTLNWQGDAMACDGMPKPGATGVRLAFREQTNPDIPGLMLVIGIANAIPGEDFDELAANVTLNDQVGGQFFSTQGEQNCWVSMTEQVKLSGTVNDIWRLDGLLYCSSALPAAAGSGSVTLGELEFSGMIRFERD